MAIPATVTLPESLPQDHANSSCRSEMEMGVEEEEGQPARTEDGHEPAVKKLKRVHGEVEMVLRQTAEIVMVLVGVAALRGGVPPSPLECQLAAEAYEKLATLVTVSAPQDLVSKDALQSLMQQLTVPLPLARPVAKPVAIQSASSIPSPAPAAAAAAAPSSAPSPAADLSKTPVQAPALAIISSPSPSPTPMPAPGSLSSTSNAAAIPPASVAPSAPATAPAPAPAPAPKAVAPQPKPVTPPPKAVAPPPKAVAPPPPAPSPVLGNPKPTASVQTSGSSSDSVAPSVTPPVTNIPVPISTSPTKAPKTKPATRTSPVKQQETPTPTEDVHPTTTVVIKDQRGSQAPKALARQRGLKNVVHEQPVLDPQQTHQQLALAVKLLLKPHLLTPGLTKTAGVFMSLPIACGICKLMANSTNNVLVCDGCDSGFHLQCLQLSNSTSFPKSDWYCPKCVTTNGGRPQPPKYGPLRRGPAGQPGPKNSWSMQGGRGSDSSKGPTPGKLLLQSRKKEVDSVQVSIEPVAATASSPPLETGANSHPEAVGVARKLDIEGPRRTAKTNMEEEHASIQRWNGGGEAQIGSKQASSASSAGGNNQEIDPGKRAMSGAVDDSIIAVEWVGPVVSSCQDNLHYLACSVGGVTVRLQDTAFFRPEAPDVPPYIARLQALWEDKSSGQKWVKVHWCYYPSDLPVHMGRPTISDPREVYESNHSDNNLVGSIQGPCLVLSPLKYQKEVERRSKNPMEDPIPLFLCQWFYDAPRGLFRSLSDASS